MAEYTEEQKIARRKAVMEYQKSVDRINCLFPKGTKDRIKKTGMSCNSFIKECVLSELDKIERYMQK